MREFKNLWKYEDRAFEREGNFARDPRSKGALECNMKTRE
jgi:hypothetical protein